MSNLKKIKLLLLVATCLQWTMGFNYRYNQPSYTSSIIKALSLGAIMMMMEVRCLKWDEIESKCRTSFPGINYWSKDWSCLASKCTNPSWITLDDLENNIGDFFTCYKETDKLFNIIYLNNTKQCMSQNLYKNTGTTTYVSIDGIIKTSHYTAITNKCTQETCFTDNFSVFPLFDQFECAPIKKPAPAGFYWEQTQSTCFYSDGIATTYTVDKNQYKFKGITGIANQPSCVKIFFNDFIPNSDKFPIKPTNPIYWNSNAQKCYFFDGIKLNKNAILIQEPVDIGYTYVSSNCSPTSCKSSHMNINPTKDDFLCLNKPEKSLIWDANKQICLYSDGTNTNTRFIKNNQNGPVVYTYGSYDTTCVVKNGLLCSLNKAINIISADAFLCQEASPLEMIYKPNCGTKGICYVRNGQNPSITDCNNDSILHSYESSDPSCLSLESCSAAFVNNDIKSINTNNFQCKKPRAEGFYLVTGKHCGWEGGCYYSDGKSINEYLFVCDDEPWHMYKYVSGYGFGCTKANCLNTNPYLLKNKPNDNNFECAQRTNKPPQNQNVYYDSQSKFCFIDKINFEKCGYPSGNGYKFTQPGSIVNDNNHPEKYCFSFFSQHESCNKNTCTFSNLNSRINSIQNYGFVCSDNVEIPLPLALPKHTSTFFQYSSNLCYFYQKTTDPINLCFYPTTSGLEGKEMPGTLVKDNLHPNNECFTATSSLCDFKYCTVDQLSDTGRIYKENFICNGNLLKLDVENVLFENGICFGGYGSLNFVDYCSYPTQFSYRRAPANSFVVDFKIDSRYGDINSSNNCYKFKSIHSSCNAKTCTKSILKTISQNDFPCFVPKIDTCSTECFYENGIKKCEKKECKIFQDGKIYKDPSIQDKNYCEKLNQWTGNEILSDSNTCATFNEKNSASGSTIKTVGFFAANSKDSSGSIIKSMGVIVLTAMGVFGLIFVG